MRKIFVDKIENNSCVLTGDKHNHLAFSLRVRPGDKIVLGCDGYDYNAEVVKVTKTQTELDIISYAPCLNEPDIDVTLFFAIMKGDKNELVAQKATELGVKSFVPFVSNNCECRKESFKLDRVRRIVVEAAEQCGRGVVPALSDVADIKNVFEAIKGFELAVFANERETTVALKDVCNGFSAKSVAIIIGSEGGFTEKEAENFINAGAKSVTLGNRILRAETASIAVVSAVMYEGGQWTVKK